MKVPLSWLKEYIEVKAKAEKIAEILTMSGTAIEGIERSGGTEVLSAEITTNRPDCLSLLGIARELSVLTGKKIKLPSAKTTKVKAKKQLPLIVRILDKQGCPGYTGRVFDNVQVGPSPAWLLERLKAMGSRPVNNVVDITNYVLFEMGQPLHAFDYDKLRGGQIVVRRAKKGEKIIGIDNIEYKLDERILVIADAERPAAIAGVMGGKDTEITASTKRIVLESARFDPILVRRAVRHLKLASDSSYRFERGVDPGKVERASERASDLIQKWARARAASTLKLAGSVTPKPAEWITLRKSSLDLMTQGTVSLPRAAKILDALGLRNKRLSASALKVRIPSLRPDITQEADLMEEVVRIQGFDKIPSRIPVTRHALKKTTDGAYKAIRRMKIFLTGQGFWETVTFGLVSREALERARIPVEGTVKVKNPLSKEQEHLTPSGLPGILAAAARNINRKEKDLRFFEIAKRFPATGEETLLTLAVTGDFHQSWEGSRPASFHLLKGVMENLCGFMKKGAPVWKTEDFRPEVYSDTLMMTYGDQRIGHCSAVREDVLAGWDILQPFYVAHIHLDAFLRLPDQAVTFQDLPKHPAVRRDIAFFIDNAVGAAEIEGVIGEAGGGELNRVFLFDEFKGKNIPEGKRSLAFSLQYQKPDGTFTDEEINAVHGRVVSALQSRFKIELRK